MPAAVPPSSTPLSTPPSTGSPSNFDSRGDTFLGQLPTFQTELNALGANAYANAVVAESAASAAATSASAAAAAASGAGATAWVSGTTYAIGDARYSLINLQSYRRKTAGAGTTDPASDPTNWTRIELSFDTAQVLTDGASIAWNASLGNIGTVTLAGNRAMANPTNLSVRSFILIVTQDGTGSRTLTWGSAFKWGGGAVPVLSTVAASKDVFSFFCDGTNLYGSYLRGVA